MKTAMQELLKAYEKCETYHQFNDWLCNNEKRLLEKEKEQMLEFGLYVKKNGWVGCKIEDLYEDYNNQNK